MRNYINELCDQLKFRLKSEIKESKYHDIIDSVVDEKFEKVQSKIIDMEVRLGASRLLLSALLEKDSGVPEVLHKWLEIEVDKIKEITNIP